MAMVAAMRPELCGPKAELVLGQTLTTELDFGSDAALDALFDHVDDALTEGRFADVDAELVAAKARPDAQEPHLWDGL
jgi:hypothetical protein